MYYLDFEMRDRGSQLPFAQVNFIHEDERREGPDFDINLNVWKGTNSLPYDDF